MGYGGQEPGGPPPDPFRPPDSSARPPSAPFGGPPPSNPYGAAPPPPGPYGSGQPQPPYGQPPHAGQPPYGAQPPFGSPPHGYPGAPGYYPGGPGFYGPPKNSGRAIAVLVLGICSIPVCYVGWIMGIIALCLAPGARREIRDSQGRVTGGGMVTGGQICAAIGIAFQIIFIILVVVGLSLDDDPYALAAFAG